MSVATAPEFVGAIGHLPPGATLRMDNVSWDDYESLLADLGESYHKRISYDRGKLEIAAPTSFQERLKSLMHTLISALSYEFDIDIESLGSTTYKEEIKARGAEPDDSFYIQNAAAVMGKDENVDLAFDPPPDLVVEIDRSSSSLDKFPIYAGLGVPELWRVHHRQVRIWLLKGNEYEESMHSQAFPFLTADVISRFLEQGITESSRNAAQGFRHWIRGQTSSE